MTSVPSSITGDDWRALRVAYRYLEHPSVAARLTALLGMPIEQGVRMLPRNWDAMLRSALHGGVETTLRLALSSMRADALPASRAVHMALGAATGALAGFFGLPALLLELPASTAIMLRGIAAVARAQGEDLNDAEARAECIKVFAFGGRSADDDAAETGYYGLRMSLALHFAPVGNAAPSSIQFVRTATSRLGFAISDKAAAQMVPVAGAVCAGLVNALFVRHFHDVAWGNFTVRRLERAHGADIVAAAYRSVAAELDA